MNFTSWRQYESFSVEQSIAGPVSILWEERGGRVWAVLAELDDISSLNDEQRTGFSLLLTAFGQSLVKRGTHSAAKRHVKCHPPSRCAAFDWPALNVTDWGFVRSRASPFRMFSAGSFPRWRCETTHSGWQQGGHGFYSQLGLVELGFVRVHDFSHDLCEEPFYSKGETGLNVTEGSIMTRNKTILPRVVNIF